MTDRKDEFIVDDVESLQRVVDRMDRLIYEHGLLQHKYRQSCMEIERLQAIIDKLPRTVDGISVTPGMTLYADCGDGKGIGKGRIFYPYVSITYAPNLGCWMSVRECYATREAIEQAEQEEQPQE